MFVSNTEFAPEPYVLIPLSSQNKKQCFKFFECISASIKTDKSWQAQVDTSYLIRQTNFQTNLAHFNDPLSPTFNFQLFCSFNFLENSTLRFFFKYLIRSKIFLWKIKDISEREKCLGCPLMCYFIYFMNLPPNNSEEKFI